MFERFTERARQVVVLAQEEARSLKHNYIGTEHILLGLLREEEGLGARALGALGVTTERVRTQVVRIVGESTAEPQHGQLPFTPRAQKSLELALREALSLGHNYIGTEHILLGLARENEGIAARILLDSEVGTESIRNEVIALLTRGRNQPKLKPAPVAQLHGLTYLETKSGHGYRLDLPIDSVMDAIHDSGDGLIGFRCDDGRMRYVAKDQIALVEPDRYEPGEEQAA